ncbi:hypothetical protein BaRGS_00016167 [Batillaria attramentaria]|uniref:Uncharacterized protein n=1 Tax=Batillaria attramentaria TaxID=370345 RepID=A0ABD0KZR0_9CAEN
MSADNQIIKDSQARVIWRAKPTSSGPRQPSDRPCKHSQIRKCREPKPDTIEQELEEIVACLVSDDLHCSTAECPDDMCQRTIKSSIDLFDYG